MGWEQEDGNSSRQTPTAPKGEKPRRQARSPLIFARIQPTEKKQKTKNLGFESFSCDPNQSSAAPDKR